MWLFEIHAEKKNVLAGKFEEVAPFEDY